MTWVNIRAMTTTSGTAGGCPVGDAGETCDTSTDCNQAENLVCSQTNALFNLPGTGICEVATSAPGYSSVLPKDKAPLPMTLKLNGYATAQILPVDGGGLVV